jgi:predicted nucleic acid-binding protein
MNSMIAERISFDTNILVYALDTAAGDKHVRAMELLDQAVQSDFVLTLQALSEFFAVATRKRKVPLEDAATQINDWIELFPVVSAGPAALRRAVWAVSEHQFAFWDALLWGTVAEAGCGILVSEDFQHGRRLRGVQFHNPFIENLPS